MEKQEHRPEKAAAPPDTAGHRGAETKPEDVFEVEPLEERHPPLSQNASHEHRGPRRRLPPAFPLGSTFLLLLLLAAVLALVAYLLGLF